MLMAFVASKDLNAHILVPCSVAGMSSDGADDGDGDGGVIGCGGVDCAGIS